MRMKTAERFWDRRARRYDEAIGDHDDAYRQRLESLRALVGPRDEVLDFGCASGEIGLDLCDRVAALRGIDVSANMIAVAEEKRVRHGIANARFERLDVHDPALAPGGYSRVLALNVLHLVDDLAGTVRRLAELTALGGLLVSETACLGEWPPHKQAGLRLARLTGVAPPLAFVRVRELTRVIDECGLETLALENRDASFMTQWIVARKA